MPKLLGFSWGKVEKPFVRMLEREVVGRTATIEHPEGQPVVHIGERIGIVVGAVWRLMNDEQIIVTREDHGHQFGLPAPVNAPEKANAVLADKVLELVEIASVTGDLRLTFAQGVVLEILTDSSGYESWVVYRDGEFFGFGSNGGPC